jgi:light-harvesting protein B-800-850 alpha chain
MSFMDYKPAEQDYRFWLVIDPSKWLIPMFIALLLLAIAVHSYAFSLPGQGWSAKQKVKVAPVAALPAPVAAPAAK